MKKISYSTALLIAIVLLGACEKWPLWVGGKEFITISYEKRAISGPIAYPAEYAETSRFVTIDTIYAQEIVDTVKVILEGVRIKSNRNNFEVLDTSEKQIEIFEKGSGDRGWSIQSEFSNNTKLKNSAVSCVLVLDMSTSIEPIMSDLKSFANTFIDDVIAKGGEGTEIAVIFFSNKNTITETPFYTKANISILKDAVNQYSNFQERTALFQATKNGLDKLTDLAANKSKCLVVFSDGGDNDTNYGNDVQEEIQNDYDGILRYCIAIKGNDFVKDSELDLKSMASEKSNFSLVETTNDLKNLFKEVSRQLSAVYTFTYNRSDANTDKIQIKFKIPVDKLK
jgi:hypothetical protein